MVLLSSHPGPREIFPGVKTDGVAGMLVNARKQIRCEFKGKSAHAGGNPWEGINALDALVASYNNVAVLRQQVKPDERIHCAFLDTPKVANVVPAYTSAYWQVRSPSLSGLNKLAARVRNCIEAGALATGCEVKISEYVCWLIDWKRKMAFANHDGTREGLYNDIRLNDTLCERYQSHMKEWSRDVLKKHERVMTASTDAGMYPLLGTPDRRLFFGGRN